MIGSVRLLCSVSTISGHRYAFQLNMNVSNPSVASGAPSCGSTIDR